MLGHAELIQDLAGSSTGVVIRESLQATQVNEHFICICLAIEASLLRQIADSIQRQAGNGMAEKGDFTGIGLNELEG